MKIHNVEQLIQAATKLLEDRQRAEESKNRPLHPTAVVFLGEKTAAYYMVLRKYMERNWGNYCKYIPFLCITSQESGDFQVKNLQTETTGLLSEKTDNVLNMAINELLAAGKNIFSNRTSIKLEFIMSSDEEKWEELYALVGTIGRTLPFNILRNLYLMMSQADENKRPQTKKVVKGLERIRQEREESGKNQPVTTIYLLSDFLKTQILIGEKLNENYRLVAELILLGGNEKILEDPQKANEVTKLDKVYGTGGFKSASFSKIDKPLKEITIATLYHIIHVLVQKSETEQCSQSVEAVASRVGMVSGDIPEASREFVKEIVPLFPEKDALKCMPRLGGYKEAEKAKRVSLDTYYRCTGQCARLFYERYFVSRTNAWLEKHLTEFCQDLVAIWAGKLTYEDIRKYFGTEEFQNRLKLIANYSASKGNDLEDFIYTQMVRECQQFFFDAVKDGIGVKGEASYRKGMVAVLEEYQTKAELLKSMVDKICGELEAENSMSAGAVLKENMASFYGSLLQQHITLIEKHKIDRLFALNSGVEEFLNGLYQIFEDITGRDALKGIYQCSFEEELNHRLDNVGVQKRYSYITSELEGDSLEDYFRIHLIGASNTAHTVYIGNQDADFVQQMHFMPADSRIDLDNGDSFEKIMIKDVDEKTINYMVEEGE